MLRPQVMGVINLNDNSFFERSRVSGEQAFLLVAQQVKEGADIIDLGVEATHPDIVINTIDADQELALLLPLITRIKKNFDVAVSIDTSRWRVMIEAIASGADIINDQRALTLGDALTQVAHLKSKFVLMQMGPLCHTKSYLSDRINACMAVGISKKNIIIDPGFGSGHFGKTTRENLQLFHQLSDLKTLGCPILVGLSRKRFIDDVLHLPVTERLIGSVSAALYAANAGADIIRVHDVKETVEALNMWWAIRSQELADQTS